MLQEIQMMQNQRRRRFPRTTLILTDVNLVSWRSNLNFDDKYLLTVSFRRDSSSFDKTINEFPAAHLLGKLKKIYCQTALQYLT
jgi:hypothetical protein